VAGNLLKRGNLILEKKGLSERARSREQSVPELQCKTHGCCLMFKGIYGPKTLLDDGRNICQR